MTDSTIILNASGTGFDASSNAFYVNPLRSATQSNVLYYNTATKEITYNTSEAAADISGVWTHDPSNNFYGPSGAALFPGGGTDGECNTFGGVQVGTSASFGGSYNTAFGYEAFMLGGDSQENVAIGAQALKSVIGGGAGGNTAVGYQALSLATAANNVAVGNAASVNLTTGGNNTTLGTCAGESLATGSNNLVLGYQAFANVNGDTSGCICLNATGTDFSPAGTLSSQLFVKPIRSAIAAQALYYNATTGEITYNTSAASADVSGAWTFDSSNNFYGPSGEAGLAGFDGEGNIAVGDGALNAGVVTGDFNVAVGTNALRDNTSGEHNVAVGREAMRDNSIGIQNTAIGHQAMLINTSGQRNVAVGDDALAFNDTGNFNIAVGWGAMGGGVGLTTHENIAIGAEALFNLEEGHNNIAIGRQALNLQRDTSSNIAIGRSAMGGALRSGSENVAVGHETLLNVSGGFANVAVGCHAGRGFAVADFDVSGSVFIGYKAGDPGFGAVTGTGNVVIGYEAQGRTTSLALTGNDCTLVGTQTEVSQGATNVTLLGARAKADGVAGRCIVLYAGDASLNAADQDTFTVKPIRSATAAQTLYYDPASGEITYNTSAAAADVSGAWTFDSSSNFYGPSGEAGSAGFDGEGNIAVGDGALNAFVVTGDFNVAVGTDALRDNTSGFHNVAVGRQAMLVNTDGTENTALGHQALAVNTSGNQNVAIGDDALLFNATGNSNIAVGFGAMGGNHSEVVSSHENIAIGREALFDLRGGHNNIAIGFEALRFQRDTSSNIAIGRQAMGGHMLGGSENVAIGHHALLNVSGGFSNVAIGYHAGRGGAGGSFDVSGSIFIGYKAGDSLGGAPTGTANIVIGYEAGATASVLSGENNILIGTKTAPGQSGDHQVLIGEQASGQGANVGNCIVLNATGSTLGATGDSTFFVKPIRQDSQPNALYYEPTTGEITYDLSGGSGGGGGSSPGILVIGAGSGTGLASEGLPTPLPSLVKITLVGGGGGGGGGGNVGLKAGGGGGGGAAWIMWTSDTNLLTTTAWQVGTGGAAGAAGAGDLPGRIPPLAPDRRLADRQDRVVLALG